MKQSIREVKGRHIFDSRGNPTIRCRVILEDGSCGIAAVPSGASTGKKEALELRDGEEAYGGKGVFHAIWNVNNDLSTLLCGKNSLGQEEIDRSMILLDGTENKSRLGANAILAVSLANAHASAASLGLPLYRYIGGAGSYTLPLPFMNVLNGGRHADNLLDIQEFMIVPVGATTFAQAMKMGTEVYHALGKRLREQKFFTGRGDEGGFAPQVSNELQALELILEAVEAVGYQPGKDVALALDAAASEWAVGEGKYRMPKSGREFDSSGLCRFFEELCQSYPLISLEDPLGEEDWSGFTELTQRLGNRVQIVGDDLFVTQVKRLETGIKEKACNAVLVKPNQVGTLSETGETVGRALSAGYYAMLSHRSGETEDTTIADLAVAYGVGQIKSGAPSGGERTAKYNRLLEIEDELGKKAHLARWKRI